MLIAKDFITYIEIHGDFTDIFRIAIACTETEIQAINQTPVLNPFLSDRVIYHEMGVGMTHK